MTPVGSGNVTITDIIDGINTATVYLFKRTSSATAPVAPSTSSIYTFSSATLVGHDGGWAQSLPSVGGAYCWMTSAIVVSDAATGSILPADWSGVTSIAQDNAMGNANLVPNLGAWTI